MSGFWRIDKCSGARIEHCPVDARRACCRMTTCARRQQYFWRVLPFQIDGDTNEMVFQDIRQEGLFG